jgi:hypothetical protein
MRLLSVLTGIALLSALGWTAVLGQEGGGPSKDEIRAEEAKALDAYKKKDYAGVLRVFQGLKDKSVDPMSMVSGRTLLEKSLNGVLAMKDAKAKLPLLKLFFTSDLGMPDKWKVIAEHDYTKVSCFEGPDGVDVEAHAVHCLQMHDKRIAEEKDEKKGRILVLERFQYLDLLSLAYATTKNFKHKTNRFVDKKVLAIRFADVTPALGLGADKVLRIVVADLDGDGQDDLLLDGREFWQATGPGRYEKKAIVGDAKNSVGLAADLDNDGDIDIVQVGTEGDRILFNNGSGEFSEGGKIVPDGFLTVGVTVADFNRDGLLDLYLVKRDDIQKGRQAPPGSDLVYLNQGKGRFAVSKVAGVGKVEARFGGVAAAGDYDNDGDTDILVGNCRFHLDANSLWENDGKGGFRDVGEERHAAGEPKTYRERLYHGHTFCTVFGDVDNDGDLDLFVGNLCHPQNIDIVGSSVFLYNLGADKKYAFEDRTSSAKIRFATSVAGCSFVDFDNDGDLDLFLTCSSLSGIIGRSFLYRNRGKGNFEEVTWQTRTLVFRAYGHAWLDYDRDGDLDLVVGATVGGLRFLRNNQHKRHAWIAFKLYGRKSNASAVGTRVVVRAGGKTMLREVVCGRGCTCQDTFDVHFGLGRFKGSSVEVEIRWPSGKIQRQGFKPKMRHIVREP